MSHAITFTSETDQDAIFTCSVCGQIIQFNKPGIGTPSAALVDGVWTAPDNFQDWMAPCTQ